MTSVLTPQVDQLPCETHHAPTSATHPLVMATSPKPKPKHDFVHDSPVGIKEKKSRRDPNPTDEEASISDKLNNNSVASSPPTSGLGETAVSDLPTCPPTGPEASPVVKSTDVDSQSTDATEPVVDKSCTPPTEKTSPDEVPVVERDSEPNSPVLDRRKLDISRRNLCMFAPEEIESCVDAKSLEVHGNNFAIFPKNIAKLTQLESVHMFDNRMTTFSGQLARELDDNAHAFDHVTRLSLEQRAPDHVDVAALASHMPRLEHLCVRNFSVARLRMKDLAICENLSTLHLEGCQLSALPPTIDMLKNLEMLNISNNSLRSLPTNICRLSNLQKLLCSRNQLSQLPETIGDLAGLSELDVRQNLLTSLPESLKSLSSCNVRLDDNPTSTHKLLEKRPKSAHKRKLLSPEIDVPVVPESGRTTQKTVVRGRRRIPTAKVKSEADGDMKISSASPSPPESPHGSASKLSESGSDSESKRGESSEADEAFLSSECPSFLRSGRSVVPSLPSKPDCGPRHLADTDSGGIPGSGGPRPAKRHKVDSSSVATHKYTLGFLGYDDVLADGFYDCGRQSDASQDLASLEKIPVVDHAREIIVVDSRNDPALRKTVDAMQAMMSSVDSAEARVRVLSMFVSSSLGGCDNRPADEGPTLLDELCLRDITSIRAQRASNVVPLGALAYGVCRHRAILFKYLADATVPRVPCALVRGYRQGKTGVYPHAWNLTKVDGKEFLIDVLNAPHDLAQPTLADIGMHIPQYLVASCGLSESEWSCQSPEWVYQVKHGKELASGSYSKVYECKFGSVKSAVVKICRSRGLSQEIFAKLLRELRIMPYIRHENIVDFLGYLISNQEVRVFMRRVHGANLWEIIRARRRTLRARNDKSAPPPFSSSEICHLARCVASAIEYIHARDIIHRDVKSENILIGTTDAADLSTVSSTDLSSSSVKLCDFNISVIAPPGVHQLQFAGTVRWCAPEVMAAHKSSNRRSAYGSACDIWSFGMVLWELLTGAIPFQGASNEHILQSVEEGKRPDISKFGVYEACRQDLRRNELVTLMGMCTSPRDTDRPTATEILTFLDKLEGDRNSKK
eukprot:276918_1